MRQVVKNNNRTKHRRTRIDAGVRDCQYRGMSAADCAELLRIPVADVITQYAAILQLIRDQRYVSGGTIWPGGILPFEADTIANQCGMVADQANAVYHLPPSNRKPTLTEIEAWLAMKGRRKYAKTGNP